MKKIQQKKFIENSSASWLLFWGAALVTIYFNPNIQDPFNAPKLWVLMSLAAWMFGHVISRNKEISSNKVYRNFFIIIFLFLLFSLISAIATDVKYTALFGENLRRNGYLTYLSLGIIALSASLIVSFANILRLIYISTLVSTILVIYGLIQHSGNDFVAWNNPYNSIIVTVGNPNFAAALMAILSTLAFTLVLHPNTSKFIKIFASFLITTLLITIYLSDARQGLISIFVGVGITLCIFVWNKRKKFGLYLGSGFLTLAVISVLGMLQIGPLKELLYKGSVSIRGYYWRAGLEMFKSNPILGVGSDRYGSFFKEYRESGYVINHGYDITSTNAHNVPIQILATGGIFVGLTYILAICYITFRAFKTINATKGANQILATGVFAAWMAYQAQSIVSIDNIGLSIWGWLLGGAIVGLSFENQISIQNKNNGLNLKSNKLKIAQPLTSISLFIVSIIFTTLLYRGEQVMYQTRATYNPQNQNQKNLLHEYAFKTINTPLIEPFYKLTASTYLVGAGFTDEGLIELNKLHNQDPRNLDTLNFLAGLSEEMGKINDAVNFRMKIVNLDPWNAKNYLALSRDYKKLGELENARKMVEKIKSFASTDPIALQAVEELNS